MIVEITEIDDPRVSEFTRLTDKELRRNGYPEPGMFIAESPKVIKIALQQGYAPVSLMCEQKHIGGDAAEILKMCGDIPVYTGTREVLKNITGYSLTRGVLCAFRRKAMKPMSELCRNAGRIGVVYDVCDTTNIGAIFRSAAALDVDAIVMSKEACDPLNRRSIRVSMGTVFLVPWTWSADPIGELRKMGVKTAAMALSDNSISLEAACLKEEEKLAVVFGTEGDGLPSRIIEECDYTVKIPMHHDVDSLNVAAAAAVTFWELRTK